MRLSSTYFPTRWSERADWYANFAVQFEIVGPTLGFTAPEVTEVNRENMQMQFLLEIMVQVDAYAAAVRGYRDVLTMGDDGDPTPALPPNPAFVPPTPVNTGMFERLDNLVKRIKLASGYTEAVGELLGIVVSGGGSDIAAEDVQPEIDLSAALHGFLFSVVVSKRHDADAWQVWAKAGGLTEFQMITIATGKSTDITYQPGGEFPAPTQLEVYVQLRRNNANYGQPSDIALVTVNP